MIVLLAAALAAVQPVAPTLPQGEALTATIEARRLFSYAHGAAGAGN